MSIENNFDWEDASEQKQGLLKLLEEQIYHSSMTDEEKEKCLHLLLESRNQPVGILLLGPTGSGKSSTINALFGKNVAKVGMGFDPETQSIEEYHLGNLTIWDCPGPGDTPQKDRENERLIREKLHETDEDGAYLVDLALVILDGSQRDMSVAHHLINDVALPALVDDYDEEDEEETSALQEEKRLLIGINKVDLLRSGWGWDAVNVRPKDQLKPYIEAKEASVMSRAEEASGKKLRVVSYCAGVTDPETGETSGAYNVAMLLYQMLRLLPAEKRIALAEHVDEDSPALNTEAVAEVIKGIPGTIWYWLKEDASEGFACGADGMREVLDVFDGCPEIVKKVGSGAMGLALGLLCGSIGLVTGIVTVGVDLFDAANP